ncbi:MAG: hypothetical protein IPP29_14505 [Bacteroidetes bacterium]|nr:hypothetical protein [Bacteroidota bacterium]
MERDIATASLLPSGDIFIYPIEFVLPKPVCTVPTVVITGVRTSPAEVSK